MKKIKFLKVILLLAICLITNNIFAQVTCPPTTPFWEKSYDSGGGSGNKTDKGYALAVDALGNTYVTGYANINGDPQITTIKYDAAGAIKWTTVTNTTYTGSCKPEAGFVIAVDGTSSTNSVWVAGTTYNGTTNYNDLTLIRYNVCSVPPFSIIVFT